MFFFEEIRMQGAGKGRQYNRVPKLRKCEGKFRDFSLDSIKATRVHQLHKSQQKFHFFRASLPVCQVLSSSGSQLWPVDSAGLREKEEYAMVTSFFIT